MMSNPGSRSHGPSTQCFTLSFWAESNIVYVYLGLDQFIFHYYYYYFISFIFFDNSISPPLSASILGLMFTIDGDDYHMNMIRFSFKIFPFLFFGSRFLFFYFFLSLWMAQRALFFNGKCRNVSTYPLFSPNKYTFSIIRMFWIWIVSHFSF